MRARVNLLLGYPPEHAPLTSMEREALEFLAVAEGPVSRGEFITDCFPGCSSGHVGLIVEDIEDADLVACDARGIRLTNSGRVAIGMAVLA